MSLRGFVLCGSLLQYARSTTRLLSTTTSLCEKSINRVQLLGRVGRDPEQRGDAYPLVVFPLATSHTIRNTDDEAAAGGEEATDKSITSWHSVTVGPAQFRKYVMDYVTKGARILVEGSLQYNKSTLPDGSIRVSTNVKANEIIILSTPRQDEESRDPHYEEDFHS